MAEASNLTRAMDAGLYLSFTVLLSCIGRPTLRQTSSTKCLMVQTVSGQLSTAAARIRTQVRSCGICGGQNGTRGGFLQVFRFPLSILIPSTAPYSLIILSSTLYMAASLHSKIKKNF
jgi:hypothetical protein